MCTATKEGVLSAALEITRDIYSAVCGTQHYFVRGDAHGTRYICFLSSLLYGYSYVELWFIFSVESTKLLYCGRYRLYMYTV